MIEDDPILGGFVAVYPSERGRPLLKAAVICGAVAGILYFTIAQVDAWWGPPLTTGVMGVVTLVEGWSVLHLWNREVILYRRGFSYREGSKVVHFLYSEIKSIRQQAERLRSFGGLLRRTVYRITLTTTQDEVIVLTNVYRRIGEMSKRLEALVNATLRPSVLRRMEHGETVAFSPTLGVSAAGLHDGERTLDWAGYGGYRIEQRSLHVLDGAGNMWASAPLESIDNATLLLDLLREREKMARGEQE